MRVPRRHRAAVQSAVHLGMTTPLADLGVVHPSHARTTDRHNNNYYRLLVVVAASQPPQPVNERATITTDKMALMKADNVGRDTVRRASCSPHCRVYRRRSYARCW
ncbi:hypothetical protein V9T40_007616 [Parthenolecanium corni]|uniref:Uncharacterized protein n=1 Tax=Parthenolecanium corni TaxID=536013 RepID=A0AAN9TJQ7_9HEMI